MMVLSHSFRFSTVHADLSVGKKPIDNKNQKKVSRCSFSANSKM
jgi:hypothetical protein